MLAYAHHIPVVDGGILVRVKPNGLLRGAEWRAHVATAGRSCLECLGQCDPANVTLERQGLLDDPSYIERLPTDHVLRQNENVFGFALGAAGLMVSQFLSLVVQPVGLGNPGAQTYHFATGMMDSDVQCLCNPECLFFEHMGSGDDFPFPVVEHQHPVASGPGCVSAMVLSSRPNRTVTSVPRILQHRSAVTACNTPLPCRRRSRT